MKNYYRAWVLNIKQGISHLVLSPAHLVWYYDLFFPRSESQTGQDKNIQVQQRQRLHPEQTQRTAQRTAGADGKNDPGLPWECSEPPTAQWVPQTPERVFIKKNDMNISRL